MTWEADNALVAKFDDARLNSPAYRCPERGTVLVYAEGSKGFELFSGLESRLSWAKRHYAKVGAGRPEDFSGVTLPLFDAILKARLRATR